VKSTIHKDFLQILIIKSEHPVSSNCEFFWHPENNIDVFDSSFWINDTVLKLGV
jgi:hypothetical protein